MTGRFLCCDKILPQGHGLALIHRGAGSADQLRPGSWLGLCSFLSS